MDTGIHHQQILEANLAESRVAAGQFGQVIRDRILQAADQASIDSDPNHSRIERFGDRERSQESLPASPVKIVFVNELSILQDQERLGVVVLQKRFQILHLRVGFESRFNSNIIQRNWKQVRLRGRVERVAGKFLVIIYICIAPTQQAQDVLGWINCKGGQD